MQIASLFTGIGAWEKALTNLNIQYEMQFFCELDKYAIESYCKIHNETPDKNIGDITKVNYDSLPGIDLLCYSPPCQSFSIAGKRGGLNDTRGTLFFNASKVIESCKPKYAIMENVKGLLSDDNGQTIETIMITLDLLGYNNYMKVLNAKDYGIPQNRERVFIVSIRKDIDDLTFSFPKKQELLFTVKDIINKYDKKIEKNQKWIRKRIKENWATILNRNNYIMCLRSSSKEFNVVYKPKHNAYRYLTPEEMIIFMGFDIKDYKKIKDIIPSTKIEKQCGNSICVAVCEAIFKSLFIDKKERAWLF